MRQGKRRPLKLGSKGGGANAPPIPARLAPFLLKPALLPGEREAEYLALVQAISAAFEPSDAVEWLWVKDVVDYTWQAQRLRRLKADPIRRGADTVLTNISPSRAERARDAAAEARLRDADEAPDEVLKQYGKAAPEEKSEPAPD